MDKELIDKNILFPALFKYATEGVVVSDRNGNIIIVNSRAESMLGYNEGELDGKKIEYLVPERFSKNHSSHRSKYFHSPEARSMGQGMILFARKKTGEELPVEISLSSFENEGQMFAISFIIDVSKRKEQENALAKAHQELIDFSKKIKTLNEDLENKVQERTQMLAGAINELEYANKTLKEAEAEVHKALDKEKELNELKSRFVTTASHEFRTPLATILSSVTLIDKYNSLQDEDKRKKHIERIKSSVNNLREILNDFLSISKLEEGSVKAAANEFELQSFFQSLVDDVSLLLKKTQSMQFEYSGNNSMVVMDKQLLKNILLNLLSNAIKYSEEGKKISVYVVKSPKEISIRVLDQGIGIPLEDQQHLFKRFFRAENATNIQGTGLGLNIVQKYVELLNGEIGFKSEHEKGTEFWVKLPYASI